MPDAVTPTGTGETSETSVEVPVTMKDVEAFVQKSLGKVHASLRIIEKSLPANAGEVKPDPVVHAEVTGAKGGSQADTVLQSRLKAVEDGQKALADEKINLAIEREALDAGVDPKRISKFVKIFKLDHGENLHTSNGAVVHREFDGDSPKPLKILIGEYLLNEGDLFKPAVSAPSGRTSRGTSSGNVSRGVGSDKPISEMSASERNKLVEVGKNGQLNFNSFLEKLRSE